MCFRKQQSNLHMGDSDQPPKYLKYQQIQSQYKVTNWPCKYQGTLNHVLKYVLYLDFKSLASCYDLLSCFWDCVLSIKRSSLLSPILDSCYYSDRSRAASGDEPLSPVTPLCDDLRQLPVTQLCDDLRRLPSIDDAMTAVENARNIQDKKILVRWRFQTSAEVAFTLLIQLPRVRFSAPLSECTANREWDRTKKKRFRTKYLAGGIAQR